MNAEGGERRFRPDITLDMFDPFILQSPFRTQRPLVSVHGRQHQPFGPSYTVGEVTNWIEESGRPLQNFQPHHVNSIWMRLYSQFIFLVNLTEIDFRLREFVAVRLRFLFFQQNESTPRLRSLKHCRWRDQPAG